MALVALGAGAVSAGATRHSRADHRAIGAFQAQRRPRASAVLVSVRLAARGSSVHSPRGPYSARPFRLSFDLGGYYGAGSKGLWIDHLKWVDWGHPVAYASGMVHARIWPSKNFKITPGGIMLDQLESCGTRARSYYTSADMAVPAGFPQNTESTATGIGEQALTPC